MTSTLATCRAPTISHPHTGPLLRSSVPPLGDDPDQYRRYALTARLLDRMLAHAPGTLRVLEVGANVLDRLPAFLDTERVQITRCDVAAFDTGPDFVVVERGRPLPFADGSFDALVALEVLEHMPAEERPGFLADCLRVVRHGAIFTCPHGTPEVIQAEELAAASYKAVTGTPHPFLEEHRAFGVPTEAEVAAMLHALDVPHACFDQAPLADWLADLLLLERTRAESAAVFAGRSMDEGDLLCPPGQVPYRQVHVIARSFEATAALEGGRTGPQVPGERGVSTPWGIALPKSQDECKGAGPVDESMLRGRATLQGVDTPRSPAPWNSMILGLMARYDAVLAAQQAERQRLRLQLTISEAHGQALANSWTARLTAPLRWLRQLLRPRGVTASALTPWQQLGPIDGAGGWRTFGTAAQFIIPWHFPAGWLRFRLRMTVEGLGHWQLCIDHGEGFDAVAPIERAEAHGRVEAEFHFRLERPIRAVRFDPLDAPGSVRIDEFSLTPVPGPWMTLRALTTKLRLLHQYGLVGRALRRGLALLASGRLDVFARKCFGAVRRPGTEGPEPHDLDRDYQTWRRRRALTSADRARLRAEAAAIMNPPLLSVLMPVHDVELRYLKRAIDSVRRQLYPHWQLCIAVDAPSNPAIAPFLERIARSEPRIRMASHERNQGIAAASNSALALAEGDYVALLDHDDEIADHALLRVAQRIATDPSVDMIYSDEDKIALDGRHVEPYFKPDWSPELFLGCMYTCHLGTYRRRLLLEIGGFRGDYDSAQDYDLVLRLLPHRPRIAHIADVLYHWRKLPTSTASSLSAKPTAWETGRRALQSYLDATGQAARAEPGPMPGLHRVRFTLQGRPRVSIIIPSACQERRAEPPHGFLIETCARSVRERSTYGNVELILVHRTGDLSAQLRERLGPLQVRTVGYEGPFNWSAAMDLGASQAEGTHLVFLNDDIEVIAPDWIEAMLEFSQQGPIGAVGARLTFPDGTHQHVGVITPRAIPQHPFHGFPGTHGGYFGNVLLHRNCSAVTGACLMTRAEVYRQVGRFDPAFSLNYNDIDYCLRLGQAGYRIVYTPYAHLCHHEALSKPGTFSSELRHFQERWGRVAEHDPCYNPNLKAHSADYQIELASEGR